MRLPDGLGATTGIGVTIVVGVCVLAELGSGSGCVCTSLFASSSLIVAVWISFDICWERNQNKM